MLPYFSTSTPPFGLKHWEGHFLSASSSFRGFHFFGPQILFKKFKDSAACADYLFLECFKCVHTMTIFLGPQVRLSGRYNLNGVLF
jgi:hypothetical protein